MTATEWAVTAVLVAILVPHVRFALRYMLRPWYRSWEGRAFLASAAAWSLVSAGFIVNFWWDVPDWMWLLIGIPAAVSGVIKDSLLTMADREYAREHPKSV